MKTLLIHPDELSKKWIDRMKDLGCTSIGIHPEGGGKSLESLKNLIKKFEDKNFTSLLDYAIEKGLEIEYYMHAAEYLLNREYFSSHPEWFRKNEKGERTPKHNFCVSSKEALDLVCKNALKLAKSLYKSSTRFYIWLDDVKNSDCKCEKCQNYSPSDQTLMVVNAIIKKLKEEIPGASLSYLAYRDTMPVPEKIKAESGIFLQYAPIERDFTKEVSLTDDEEKKKMINLIEFFGRKNSAVLEYWYDNSLFSKWQKPPKEFKCNNEIIKKDIEFYRNIGFEKIESFACFLGDDYEKLYGEPDISAFSHN